ncbi:MAG: hypothetical protein U5K69_00270 [Balneolaceae bacterium]|nr:hypothetical protein [Balneolaceae bacterium]
MRLQIILLTFLLLTVVAFKTSAQEVPFVYEVENTEADLTESPLLRSVNFQPLSPCPIHLHGLTLLVEPFPATLTGGVDEPRSELKFNIMNWDQNRLHPPT